MRPIGSRTDLTKLTKLTGRLTLYFVCSAGVRRTVTEI